MRDERCVRQMNENKKTQKPEVFSCRNLTGETPPGHINTLEEIDREVRSIPKVKKKEKMSYDVGMVEKNTVESFPLPTEINDISEDKLKEAEYDSSQKDATRSSKAYELAYILLSSFSFVSMSGQLYQYDEEGGYWMLIKESESNRAIRRLLLEEQCYLINRQSLCEIYEWLLILSKEVVDDPDARRHYLNFRDCALDWSTGDELKERKDLYFKYALQVDYADVATKRNDSFKKFVNDIFGDDKKTKKEFRKFLGLCLSDIRDLKLAVFLYGPSNTGKSVLLNLLRGIVGTEWCSSLSFTQMSNEFAITQLLGKRLNLSGEVSGASNKRLDIFKSLTGNDDVTACFKGKDHFQFKNECLLVFACNSFPPISALDEFDSFLSRIIIFPFLKVKQREEWIENLEKVLMADIASIIEMATKGLRELEEDSYCFNQTDAMLRCKHDFIGIYNSFVLFAEACICEDPDSTVTSDEIRNQYKIFCRNEGLVAVADNVWSQYLKQHYACKARTITKNTDMGDRRLRGYQGIRLEDKIELETENEDISWMEELL